VPEPTAAAAAVSPTELRNPGGTRVHPEGAIAEIPPAEPAALVAPDGTVIAACGTPPPGMACVPGGPFVRGSDAGPPDARPQEQVWLQTYYMDLYEVTYAEYKHCQKFGPQGSEPVPEPPDRRCPRGGPLYNDFSRARQPITGVTWFGADAYCRLHGKHLPTEAQWEKAARGPDGATFAWGNDPATCERAVIKDENGRSCGVKKLKEHPDKGRTFEVGSRPPGAYGLFDMAGNAWEWVADWYSKDWARCGAACRGVDPKGPCGGAERCAGHTEKVARGGSWYWEAKYAQSFWRRPHVPDNDPFHHFGFRCAASLDEAAPLQAGAGQADTTTPATPEG